MQTHKTFVSLPQHDTQLSSEEQVQTDLSKQLVPASFVDLDTSTVAGGVKLHKRNKRQCKPQNTICVLQKPF